MKTNFAVDAQGAGTLYVESLHSILARTAHLRRINLHYLIRFVCASELGGPDAKGVKSLGQILGGCNTALRLSRQFSRLDESDRCYRHSFVKLAGALQRPQQFPLRLRWCPRCLDPEQGVGYSMLAHALVDLVACPMHKCALRDRCANCGHKPSTLMWSPDKSTCNACGKSLVEPMASDHVSAALLLADAQFYRFITYATDPDQAAPPNDWREAVQAGLRNLLANHYDSYGPSETARMRLISRDIRPLAWRSIVQLASIQAVDVVELLETPTQALSPRLPGMGIRLNVHSRRRRVDSELAERLLRTANEMLELDQSVQIPSLKLLAIIVGVSYSYFWDRNRRVCATYAAERTRKRKAGGRPVEARLPRQGDERSAAELLATLAPEAHKLVVENLGSYVGTDGRVNSYPNSAMPRPVRWSTAKKQLRMLARTLADEASEPNNGRNS